MDLLGRSWAGFKFIIIGITKVLKVEGKTRAWADIGI